MVVRLHFGKEGFNAYQDASSSYDHQFREHLLVLLDGGDIPGADHASAADRACASGSHLMYCFGYLLEHGPNKKQQVRSHHARESVGVAGMAGCSQRPD
jgi:hypothetical protein